MRAFALLVAFLLFLRSAVAVPELKSVIIWFDDGVADHIMNQAMDAVRDAGGNINHVYNLIKGFSAKAPASSLENLMAMHNGVHIEEDQMVSTQGRSS